MLPKQCQRQRLDMLKLRKKLLLYITWACKKFSETDHKPLVVLLGNKHLDSLPPRVLRLMRFSYSIQHIPGKLLYTADALFRPPMREKDIDPQTLEKQSEVESFIAIVTSHLPASQN